MALTRSFNTKSVLRHRYHDFQHKDAVRTFYRALAVVFFHCISDVGQSETVEKGVILGGFSGGVCVRKRVVFHQNDQHVADAPGFDGDDPEGNRQFFAGLDGVVQNVAENSADIQRVQEGTVGEMDDRSEVNLFFSGGFRLVPDDDVQLGVAGAVIVHVG